MKQPKKTIFSSAVSRIGLALILATALFVGLIGIAGATNPTTAPLVHATYKVNNDADSGANGYWALDNFTAQVTIWKTGANTYEVNMTNTGIWCTFAGSPTPGLPTATQGAPECGSMEGGYDGNLTTSVSPVNTIQTTIVGSPFDAGGTELNGVITPGSFSGQFAWVPYFFPGAGPGGNNVTFSKGGNGWNWTYIAPNGNKWIDSGPDAGSLETDGQITSVQSSSVEASADLIPPTCALNAAGGVSFGQVTPDVQILSQDPFVNVTNDGTTNTAVGIYGSDWSNNPNSVGWTFYNLGSSYNVFAPSHAALSYSPGIVVPGSNLAAYGGSEPFSFALAANSTITSGGQHTQTITFVSQC